MRKLTEKVIEAGIIPDQAVELMKLWGIGPGMDLIAENDHETKRQLTQEQLLRMVEEIAALLEEKSEIPELRETDLDIERIFKAEAEMCQVGVFVGDHYVDVYMLVAQNRAGQLIFSREHTKSDMVARPGNRVKMGHTWYEIFEVETRYEADEPKFDVCIVKEVPDAKV